MTASEQFAVGATSDQYDRMSQLKSRYWDAVCQIVRGIEMPCRVEIEF